MYHVKPIKTGLGGISVYWCNNGGCQLCMKVFSDYLSNIQKTPFRGIRITKNTQHSNCLIVNGANCLTQSENVIKDFSKILENAYIVLFGDCGMEQSSLFKSEKNAKFFYASDTQEAIPITHRIHGCPPSWDEINRFFASIFEKEKNTRETNLFGENEQNKVEQNAENTQNATRQSA